VNLHGIRLVFLRACTLKYIELLAGLAYLKLLTRMKRMDKLSGSGILYSAWKRIWRGFGKKQKKKNKKERGRQANCRWTFHLKAALARFFWLCSCADADRVNFINCWANFHFYWSDGGAHPLCLYIVYTLSFSPFLLRSYDHYDLGRAPGAKCSIMLTSYSVKTTHTHTLSKKQKPRQREKKKKEKKESKPKARQGRQTCLRSWQIKNNLQSKKAGRPPPNPRPPHPL